jgi:hypothetical protein
MPLDIWVRIRGDAPEVAQAVIDTDAEIGKTGDGVDWAALGTKMGSTAKGAMSSPLFQGAMLNAGMMAVDWLLDGVSKALDSPEGAEAKQAMSDLGVALGGIRDQIIAPLLPVIRDVALAAIPLVIALGELLGVLLPPIQTALGVVMVVVGIAWSVVLAIRDGITTAAGTIGALAKTAGELIAGVAKTLQGILDGISQLWEDIKKGIGDLLAPIQGLLGPIGDAQRALQGLLETIQAVPGESAWDLVQGGGLPGANSITVNPGAGSAQVVAALHRWAARNGGAAAVQRAIGAPA